MYLVIRKFNHISSMAEAARRAESGLGQLLKQSPGFQGYYVFDAGKTAAATLKGFEIMRMIRRGHCIQRKCRATGEIRLVNQLFGLAA